MIPPRRAQALSGLGFRGLELSGLGDLGCWALGFRWLGFSALPRPKPEAANRPLPKLPAHIPSS